MNLCTYNISYFSSLCLTYQFLFTHFIALYIYNFLYTLYNYVLIYFFQWWHNKAFRHAETLFVQGNQVRTDQNKPDFLLIQNKICFDQYELDYLGRIKFLHVEMPYTCSEVRWRITTQIGKSNKMKIANFMEYDSEKIILNICG